jgi:4-aminobutyrate aminotransferase-like enzyme
MGGEGGSSIQFSNCAGKPCGNGLPMAGLVTTPALAAGFSNGMEFFATFGEWVGRCSAAAVQWQRALLQYSGSERCCGTVAAAD